MDHNTGDLAGGRDFQQNIGYTVLHVLGNPSQDYISSLKRLSIRSKRETVELFLQLSLAQEIAQRRADVIKLLYVGPSGLALSWDIEISRLAVSEKEFLSGLVVLPTHSARLLQPENPTLAAGDSGTGVSLSKCGLETFEIDRKSTRLNSSHQIISYAV